MLDTSQIVVFVFLIVAAIVSVVFWFWEWRDLFAARTHGTVGAMTLKHVVAFVLICPVMLTGSVGAVWIYFKGWEDFTRTMTLCIGFGALMGAILTSFFYIINRVSRRMMKIDNVNIVSVAEAQIWLEFEIAENRVWLSFFSLIKRDGKVITN